MKPITRKEKIIAGEELTPITREEMFLSKYGGGGGSTVQSDLAQNDPTKPDYVKNRTHYEETTVVNEPLNITWDGNTEGLVSDASGFFYKVSDNIFTDEQIKTMSETLSDGIYLEYSEEWDAGIEEGWIIPGNDITACSSIVVVRVDGAIVELAGVSSTFPEKGLYFVDDENLVHVASLTSTEPVEHTKTVVHKLDKKFLPYDMSGGKITLYALQGDHYMYSDEQCTTKITATKLDAMVKSGFVEVFLTDKDNTFVCYPWLYKFSLDSGCVIAITHPDDGTVWLHTSEYGGPK